jgi:cephalosporin hydroxylase
VNVSDPASQLPRRFQLDVDLDRRTFDMSSDRGTEQFAFDSPQGAALAAHFWKQVGWDTKHVYSFTWHGRPVIQVPDDLVRMQEAFFEVAPDLVIEVGVAHGGSAVFFAGLCAAQGFGEVVAVELELRQHNREALDAHPLRRYITFVEGNSIGEEVVDQVRRLAEGKQRVLVFLDGNHTKAHVAAELELYSPLVTDGSWLIVADGIMNELEGAPRSKPTWQDDNPVPAIHEFLAQHPEFEHVGPPRPFDESSFAPTATYFIDGWLKRRSTR